MRSHIIIRLPLIDIIILIGKAYINRRFPNPRRCPFKLKLFLRKCTHIYIFFAIEYICPIRHGNVCPTAQAPTIIDIRCHSSTLALDRFTICKNILTIDRIVRQSPYLFHFRRIPYITYFCIQWIDDSYLGICYYCMRSRIRIIIAYQCIFSWS